MHNSVQASMLSRFGALQCGPSSFSSRTVVLGSLCSLPGLPACRPYAVAAAAVGTDLSPSSVYGVPLPLRVSGYGLKTRGVCRTTAAAAANQDPYTSQESLEASKLGQVSKRLEQTARYFSLLGSIGFWGQLVCTVVAAVILAFSVAVTGAATAPISLYLTAAGIAAAFVSVFWSFGYIRLSKRLRATIDDPTKAPPRAQVVQNLRNGIIINLLGMGATLLGMQATVGILVAKALTSSAQPILQGQAAGYSPVLALDVFVVQASANAVLSHFLGLVFSLELLQSVTLSNPSPENVVPKLT